MIHLYAIGSPLEQDNLAWLLMENIQSQLTSDYPELCIEYFDRPGIQLVNEMSDKQRVILVDALLSKTLSDIQSLQIDDLKQPAVNFSSHGYGVVDALQLSQQLNLLPESLWIFGIPVAPQASTDRQTSMHLSEQLLRHIEQIINQHGMATV